ncbi:MAG TPA: VIT family protein [Candidatus Saccharimonadales bacterium]|nr:VIT family protein [Candidatus Saccharimonadales bacterium]
MKLRKILRSSAVHSDQDSHTRTGNVGLNRLRAAVLGANDGIVSVASIVLGVAGATSSKGAIFTAGLAGLTAGALSMAVGEYVSVSAQRDTERAFVSHEKWELETKPNEELAELASLYEAKGVSPKTAQQVAKELTAKNPLKAHLDAELNIDPDDLTNPLQAAIASLFAFVIGAIIPLLSVTLSSANLRFIVTFVSVLVALVFTGYLSATAGGASRRRAILRVVVGGAVAMIVTYGIGKIFGTAVS